MLLVGVSVQPTYSRLFPGQLPQKRCEFCFVHALFRDGNHGVVQFLRALGHGDTITLQEHQSCCHAGAFVSIKERLGLGNVESISCRNVEQISLRVVIDVPRMNDRAFNKMGSRNPWLPPKRSINLTCSRSTCSTVRNCGSLIERAFSSIRRGDRQRVRRHGRSFYPPCR
jgi:hypothetical protein